MDPLSKLGTFNVRAKWALLNICVVSAALRKDCRAGVAPLLALVAIPLFVSVGCAVDYSRASALRTAMQVTLDSTALTLAARDGQGIGQASQLFTASFAHPEVHNLQIAGTADESGDTLSVSLAASGTVKTTFMSIMGFQNLLLKVKSTAAKHRDDSGCVLALDTTASGAISNGGSTNTALNNCSVFSNSNNATGITVGGSATLSAYSIGSVGGASLGGDVVTTNGVRTGVFPISDPYYNATYPSFSGCTQTHLNVNKSTTIDPGVYCDGLTVNAGATLTLNPGIYYIDQGSFSVNGGATITGQGVTLVFTSSTGKNWATATINGNASVDLTAPIGGPTAGIAIFADRQIPTGTAFKFDGGASQHIGGVIYVPTGAVSYAGGSTSSTSCTKIIGDTVEFTGNSNLAINCNSLPTKDFGATVVRLVS